MIPLILSLSRSARVLPLAAALVFPTLALAADPSPTPSVSVAEPVKPTVTESPKPSAAKMPRTPESAVTPINRNPIRHRQFLSRIKEAPVDLLFLGDSITDNWPRLGEVTWLKFAPYRPADFGISGERTEDVLWRITNGELDGIQPKVVVLMIGTNNVGQHPDEQPEWVIAGVRKIVDAIHEKLPASKVLLLAIFPRDGKDSSNRQRNDAANVELAKMADGDKIRYLDINHVFLNANGEIPREIMPDVLHPNGQGYELWYDAMRPTLDEMMK